MFEGEDVLKTAEAHLGEPYVLGARAELDNADYKGPWDCAEFASWCVFQTYGVLFGTTQYGAGPDPYSGAWIEQARAASMLVGANEAAHTPGAVLLRARGAGLIGHVAISDGTGGTIEARGSRYGVVRAPAAGRLWHHGCHVPGVRYTPNPPRARVEPPSLLELAGPLMRGSWVKAVQEALRRHGFDPGPADGIYGRRTAKAVTAFQARAGLVPDAITGPETARALGLHWPPETGELE